MDKVYVECCGSFSTAFSNWNEAFQLAWELEDTSLELAQRRQQEIYHVESAFETEAAEGAMRIVTMELTNAPKAIPKQLLCYRDRNIFYRVLPESRSGRNYVASLRGVLQTRSSVLTVPLTCFFMYRGTPVLAQALVPLARDPIKAYGDGAVQPHPEIEAEVEIVADALNTPLPDHVVMETYEGLDGRYYVTSTNITTIALDDATLIDGPIKRAEMLSLCPCVTATCEDTLNVLRNPSVLAALRQVASTENEPSGRQKLLCDTLHFYGVNLCLLKGVLDAVRLEQQATAEEWEGLKTVVAVEMLARTVKQEFSLESQAKRLGLDDLAVSKCFALRLKDAFETDPAREGKFLQAVVRKYAIGNIDGENAELLGTIMALRRESPELVVERASILLGARAVAVATNGTANGTYGGDHHNHSSTTSGRKTVVWAPLVAARVAPRLCDPKMLLSLDPLYANTVTNKEHYLSFCLPLRIRVAAWQGRWGDALNLASEGTKTASARYGHLSLRCLRALATFCRLLFGVPSLSNVSEGSALLAELLDGFERWGSAISRAKLHIDAGCWLLGASHVVDMTDEACRHFLAAEEALPPSLRSSFGAWLFIKPSLGLLRCRQLMAPGPDGRGRVPVVPLAKDAVYLAKTVTPADYIVEYLWELGMELQQDSHPEEAAKVLTIAVGMGKKVPRSMLDLKALLADTLNVYRSWDPTKYSAYCTAVATM